MRHIYTFAPYMLVVYGEKNAGGYLLYRGRTFPLSGAQVGADGKVSFGLAVPGLASIGAGMRYTMADPAASDESYQNGFLKSYYSPLLLPKDAESGPITLAAVFDPGNPAASRFAFSDTGREFAAAFTDIYGQALTIAPLAGACLVLERRAVYRCKGGAQSEYYLGLSGPFAMKGANLLCGDTGTEYIAATTGASLTASFVPGQNAHSGDTLENHTTCAYLSFPAGGDYCCQSAEAPFFTPAGSGAANGVFQYLPLKLTVLPDAAAPLFPVRDTELEQVLAARRYSAFTQAKAPPQSAADIYAVTKNGLLATVRGGELKEAVLAMVGDDYVKLTITEALRFELQAAQPKLMFTEYPAELEGGRLALEGWTLSFTQADWLADTRIILKYSADTSIEAWLSGDETLAAAIKQTKNADGTPAAPFEEFMAVIKDENFTGMLVLNCQARFTGSGDAAAIIAAARGTITAHHVIVRAGRIDRSLALQPSLINAVVHYVDSEAQTSYSYNTPAPDYGFVTTEILSVIERGAMVLLKTVSELLINKLFDCPTGKEGEGGSALIIDGELRSRSGVSSFEYALRSAKEYTLANSRLERVLIDSVTLAGSVFSLGGGLGFPAPPDGAPDLLGYGGDTPLRFADLRIQAVTRQAVTTYQIDYVNLAVKRSEARAGSFAQVFPAPACAVARATKPPAELGIVTLATPIGNASLTEFAAPWWSVSYPLIIGNLGELSGGADFALTVVFCWRGESFYAGVVPPGGMLGAGLPMSGVLGFTAKAVTLAPVLDADQQVTAYNLGFTGIALKLLKYTLPPGGNVSLVVSGGADGIAWKAVYEEK
ncbi:MAG: hypothetical protein LBI54_10810 [Lachnospiraceae bacterium]|jgi:hypothetical protein|nr:hypothetical protein [Lachnospiraceae bacterium]